MIFRDEAPYLKEWIEYYRLMGAEHFYLASHNSRDDFQSILSPYIEKGIIELKLINDTNKDLNFFISHTQVGFFNETLKKAKKESKWVAFLDSDEFLVPLKEHSLVHLLRDYEKFGGLVANWHMFGTSNVAKLDPDKLMIEQLIYCAAKDEPVQQHVKSILQPKKACKFVNPHYAKYKRKYYHVNTNKEPLRGARSNSILYDRLKINHYWTRDEFHLWEIKAKRHVAGGNSDLIQGVIKANNDYNLEKEISILRFVSSLKKRMNTVNH